MTPEKRLELIPPSYRATYLAAMSGRSRAKGVKAFCQGCVGYERKSVRNCTDPGCSLYPYRPYQNRSLEEIEREEEEVKTDDVVEEPVVPKKAKKKKKTSSKVTKKKTPTTKKASKTSPKKKSRFKNRTRK